MAYYRVDVKVVLQVAKMEVYKVARSGLTQADQSELLLVELLVSVSVDLLELSPAALLVMVSVLAKAVFVVDMMESEQAGWLVAMMAVLVHLQTVVMVVVKVDPWDVFQVDPWVAEMETYWAL